ncbi:TRAP transporter small permease [Volucribacter amazonae]|uniref:TRAP transporter small permease protein n=1 Tax=Volucribacter amazonae TaxID=256731 RepID=A0A9X4SQ89_9PAST|nr:TRAP transporter small permease [Volucribacter amazonae]MDG6895016.1 C4-dicarboxylate ABC transporter permease [Volucribacter amazonae]
MRELAQYVNKALEFTLVVILAVMSVLVFINVVLRYGFHSSISMTEELSRYLFVWLTFLGAILAFSENQHVRVTMFIDKLTEQKRKILSLFTDGLMLYCCYLILMGSWIQFQLNINNIAPISGIPIGINFLASLIAAIAIGLLLIARIFSTLVLLIKGVNK